MSVVKMGRDRGKSEATIILRKVVEVPYQIGSSVPGDIGRSGERGSITVVECPESLNRKIGGHAEVRLVLRDFVKLRRREKLERLVIASALFSGFRVRLDRWSGIETRDGLGNPHDLQRLDESPRVWACRFERRHTHRVRPR